MRHRISSLFPSVLHYIGIKGAYRAREANIRYFQFNSDTIERKYPEECQLDLHVQMVLPTLSRSVKGASFRFKKEQSLPIIEWTSAPRFSIARPCSINYVTDLLSQRDDERRLLIRKASKTIVSRWTRTGGGGGRSALCMTVTRAIPRLLYMVVWLRGCGRARSIARRY